MDSERRTRLLSDMQVLDRLFGDAEASVRASEYDTAADSYREFVLHAEEVLERLDCRHSTAGACLYCGWPISRADASDRGDEGPYCDQCRSAVESLTYVSPDELPHLQEVATRTVQGIVDGEVGLEWTRPDADSSDKPPVDEYDLSGRDVALRLVGLSQALGRPPTPRDVVESDSLALEEVLELFDGWDAALDAAGLTSDESSPN